MRDQCPAEMGDETLWEPKMAMTPKQSMVSCYRFLPNYLKISSNRVKLYETVSIMCNKLRFSL
jgi:hypothetical protein